MRNFPPVFTHRAPNAQSPATAPEVTVWRPLRGPFERWPHLSDLSIALISFLLNLLMWSLAGASQVMAMESLPDVGAYLCMFVANLALLWRRSHPWQAHWVVLGISLLLYIAAPVNGVVALAFSLYSLGRFEADKRVSLIGVLAALAFIIVDLMLFNTPNVASTIATMMVPALWYVGRRLRFRGEYLRLLEERARYLEREQTTQSERAVAAERTRIAREMHDIVAHQVSLMTIQAGAARTIAVSNPAAACDVMASVEAAGRHALSEMRHLLGVLRPANNDDVLQPQPGIGDIDNLVNQVRNTGLVVQLHTEGDLSDLPTRLELTAYRLVQEALTNVIKHANANSQVVVSIFGGRENVTVVIKNDGKKTEINNTGGHGIVGMRERVQLLGGSFSAHGVDGGFEVRAILPRDFEVI